MDSKIEKTSEEDFPPDFIPAAAVPFLVAFFRYTGGAIATIVTTLLGMYVAFSLPNLGEDLLISGPETFATKITVIGTGFFSVLIGTVITPKASWHISSWAYTVVGAFWYIWVWSQAVYALIPRMGLTKSLPPFLPLLPWALLGGFACSLLFTLVRKRSFRD
jgi:hypothetical protein